MTKEYEPEVGQAIFGQPSHELEVERFIIQGLVTIGEYIYSKKHINPTENTAANYENDIFQMFAYDWSDEDQPYNFRWKDFEVSWYKYLGRGTSMNREISEEEFTKLMNECIDSITSGEKYNEKGNFVKE